MLPSRPWFLSFPNISRNGASANCGPFQPAGETHLYQREKSKAAQWPEEGANALPFFHSESSRGKGGAGFPGHRGNSPGWKGFCSAAAGGGGRGMYHSSPQKQKVSFVSVSSPSIRICWSLLCLVGNCVRISLPCYLKTAVHVWAFEMALPCGSPWLGAAPTGAPPPVSWDWLIIPLTPCQLLVHMFFVLFHFLNFFLVIMLL